MEMNNIDELIHTIVGIIIEHGQNDYQKFKLGQIITYTPSEILEILKMHKEELMKLSSVEPLTDKEQRIFLAAMGREEQVCKVVDQEARYAREAYEDRLEFICKEIIRKVKGALWT